MDIIYHLASFSPSMKIFTGLSVGVLVWAVLMLLPYFLPTRTVKATTADAHVTTSQSQSMQSSPGAVQILGGSVTFNQLSQEQKHSTIRSEVLKLLRFPNASGGLPSQTSVIEQLLVNKLPQKMFSLLIQFDGKDVSGLPKIGAQLDNHLASYDRFHEESTLVERDLLPRIGDMVRVSFRQGWRIYFRYVVMRFAERSKEDIIRDGNFLNYEITWDDAERVFIELNKKSAVRDRFVKIFRLYNEMILSLATLNKVMVGG